VKQRFESSTSASTREETQALRVQAMREIARTYASYNETYFRGTLRRPTLEWTESRQELGAWVPKTRHLRLSVHLLSGSWGRLVEVLKHEMAHQYVHEVLGATDETAHGATFRQVCAERGIDPRAAEQQGADQQSEADSASPGPEPSAIVARIMKLLALAQSQNQFEAEAAMAAARRLLLKHNLSLPQTTNGYAFRHLGAPTGRRVAWQRALCQILSDFFFVEIIIVPVYRPEDGKAASVVEACGTAENLEIAAYAYEFLERQAEELWRAHQKTRATKGRADHGAFLLGVMTGFHKKLKREGDRAQEEGLVWVGDPELSRYFRARHPYIRTVHGRGSQGGQAYRAGQEAGEQLVIRRGIQQGASSGPPRLLPR
jgi:predicted SprT family Zn-dependent metalloprotease